MGMTCYGFLLGCRLRQVCVCVHLCVCTSVRAIGAPGFRIDQYRGDKGGRLQDIEIDDPIKDEVFYWDNVHPSKCVTHMQMQTHRHTHRLTQSYTHTHTHTQKRMHTQSDSHIKRQEMMHACARIGVGCL